MIRAVEIKDKSDFIKMTTDFYKSDAVLHSIPIENIYKTFDELCKNSPYVKSYVVDDEGKLKGYALLSLTYSNEAGGLVLWFEEIYIKPEHQGEGLGKKLMSYIEKKYDSKVSRIRLEIEPDNIRAKKLYENLGFTALEYSQMYKDKIENS